MTTCKDCLHYESCGGFIPTDLDKDVFHYCREGMSDEIPDIEERCSDFNDRRNYVEVVHGEWIMVIDENDCECIECPLCGEQFYDGDNDTFDKPYNYCPNCGADMRGDGNG